jgi:hypothetical protein
MKKIQEVENKINQLKIKLSKKPLRENFGDGEIRELEEYVGYIWDYPYQERLKIQSLQCDFFMGCAVGKKI